MAKVKTLCRAWALTGSGHFFKECLRTLRELDDVDLFVRKTASDRAQVSAGIQIASSNATLPRYDREHADPGAGDIEHGSKVRGEHFRDPRHQRIRASREVPGPSDRIRLRYRTRTRD